MTSPVILLPAIMLQGRITEIRNPIISDIADLVVGDQKCVCAFSKTATEYSLNLEFDANGDDDDDDDKLDDTLKLLNLSLLCTFSCRQE
jgi:hypothetical protein